MLDRDTVLAASQHVGDKLARRLAFGFWEEDDIRQEIFLLAVDAASRFDEGRASGQDVLTQFKNQLYVHCVFKLGHKYRDKYHRSDPPCAACGRGDPCTPGGCEHFREWRATNAAKAALFSPARGAADPRDGRDRGDHGGRSEPAARPEAPPPEVLDRVKARLGPNDRGDLLRLLAGARFPKGRRMKLLNKIRKIVREIE